VGYDRIMGVLTKYKGAMPVVLYDERTGKRSLAGDGFWVNPYEDMLLKELKGLCLYSGGRWLKWNLLIGTQRKMS
jgi:hypothetical protein